MLKVFATQVVISRGYDNKPAISITRGNDSAASVRFRIGKKVYDPKAENNTRWLNYSVKGFGPIVDRIEKMQLKEGSFINIEARLDEDTWEDQTTKEKKSCPVLILDEIEYAPGGGKSNSNGNATNGTSNQAPAQAPAANTGDGTGGFTGFEPFGGNSFFDDQN